MASPVYAPCIGGGERLLQLVAERLAGRGHQVTVVTLDAASQPDMLRPRGSGLPPDEILNGVRIRRVAPGGGRTERAFRWWLGRRGGWRSAHLLLGDDATWLLGPPSAAAMLPRLLSVPADLMVSANWGFPSTIAVDLAGRLRRVPVVGLPLFHIARPWADQARYSPMLARCRAVVALTSAEGEFIRKRGGRRVEVIGCGVEPDRFAAGSAARGRARLDVSDRPVVGFIGRQDALKGVPTLLEAMQKVWLELPEAVLLLAGPSAHRDAATTERLAALTPEQQAHIRLVDDFSHAEAPDLFAACDLVVLPSVEEAFGLVFLEAWASRRPVIGVRVPSTECVVQEGVDGLITRPMDPGELAAAILQLLHHPEIRATMAEQGHQKVLAQFSLDRITDRWEALLLGLGRRSPG